MWATGGIVVIRLCCICNTDIPELISKEAILRNIADLVSQVSILGESVWRYRTDGGIEDGTEVKVHF